MLIRRYDNPRIRLSNHLEKLIQLPQLHSLNVTDLNSLLDHYDNWLVHCILRKLDPPHSRTLANLTGRQGPVFKI